MIFDEQLRGHFVLSDVEPDTIDFDGFGFHILRVSLAEILRRQTGLDQEEPIIGEMPSDVLEAANLVALRAEVVKRVEND